MDRCRAPTCAYRHASTRSGSPPAVRAGGGRRRGLPSKAAQSAFGLGLPRTLGGFGRRAQGAIEAPGAPSHRLAE